MISSPDIWTYVFFRYINVLLTYITHSILKKMKKIDSKTSFHMIYLEQTFLCINTRGITVIYNKEMENTHKEKMAL
jgi:hypothetical protein